MSEPSVSSNAVHQLRVVLCGVSWCGGDYSWSAKPVSLNSVKSFRMPSVGAANICTASLYVARPMGFRIWATSASVKMPDGCSCHGSWPTLPASPALKHSLGHGLMHGGEKGVVVKRFNEIGDRPSLYRRVPHQVVVVRRTYDDARLGRNGLELLLDFEAAHT
jgi:hypothetical protein